MADFDFDLLNELVNDAPTAGFGPQVNFGKLVLSVTVCSWKDKKLTETAYTNQKVNQGEYLRLNFECDLSEFNPALTNPYKRRVDVKKSNKTGDQSKWTLTDWEETVKPNLEKVVGKDYFKKLLKGVYCEFESAETVERNKQGELKGWDTEKQNEVGETVSVHYTNTVPRILRVFKSKAECAAAHAERFTKSNGNLEVNGSDIPEKIINDARGLITALGSEQAKGILSSTAPYNTYDLEQLISAANPL